MKTAIGILIVLAIIAGGVYWYQGAYKTSSPVSDNQNNGQQAAAPIEPASKSYALAEISQHATGTDCWLAISGKVYDVTPMIAGQKHPGGAAILEGCGKDATALFDTRPMGSKTPHSDKARSFLPSFLIGELARQ